jgi:NADPH2:quinone reductase
MAKAIRIYQHGAPEVLRWEEVDPGVPGAGEVLVRNTAVGLNFVDVYARTGLYPMQLPGSLGSEAAGVVVTVGNKVKSLKAGDRVVYLATPPGAYSELKVCAAQALHKIPAAISDEQAAALLLKGLTAHYLLRRTYRVRKGDTVLIHAAAGGVGLILCQWARHLGARVIGVTSSEQKARLAKRNGCHQVILAAEDQVTRVKQITRGKGVDVVYDSVGKDTFMASLDCLRPMGMMVSYGNASGPPPAISPLELMRRGSLYLTRPTGLHYSAARADRDKGLRELFSLVRRGIIKIHIGQRYPLKDVARAHRDLEARRTVGSTVLIP